MNYDMQAEIARRCTAAGLDLQVPGAGSPSAKFIIIAEAPGDTEVQAKMPLVGASGAYLWKELARIGISRNQCYVTNVVKRRLNTKANVKEEKIAKSELNHWETILRYELSNLENGRYMLLLGGYACSAVTGFTGVEKWRGSSFEYSKESGYGCNGRMLVAYNPAYILREPSKELAFKIDVSRFGRIINNTYKPHVISPIINPTFKEAIEYVKDLTASPKEISFDIETINNETACIGVTNENHSGMCIAFRDSSTSVYTVAEETEIRIALARMFAAPNTRIVAQNGNFDSYWLWYKDRLKVPHIHADTLLAHHTLYPSLPHSLGFLTTQYTEHPYYKDEIDTWRSVGDINKFWEYNVKDICITRYCYEKLDAELKQQKLDKFFYEHVMRLQHDLVTMTVNGVLIDESLRAKIETDLKAHLRELEANFTEAVRVCTGDPELFVNPNSPLQLKKLFFEKLKLVGRGVSTNEKNRNNIMLHPKTPPAVREMLTLLDTFKGEYKFYSTYAKAKADEDSRMRSEWRQWGVQSAPGRLSSSAVMWGSGANLQNIPARAKEMFIAPRGYGFAYFDLKQAEAMYVAYRWNVKKLKSNFERALVDDSYDIHRANAVDIFKVPYEEVPTFDFDEHHRSTLRYKSKRCVHGLNYRLQPDGLAQSAGIPLLDAMRAHRMYHAAFPEVSQAWDKLIKQVLRDKCLYNCYGRRWVLLERVEGNEDALKSIVAFDPQSTIGDKVARTIYLCHSDPEWPRDRDGNLLAAVTIDIHDALLAVAPLDLLMKVGRIMKKHAEEPLDIDGQKLIIPAEVGLSQPDKEGIHRWSSIKKMKLQ